MFFGLEFEHQFESLHTVNLPAILLLFPCRQLFFCSVVLANVVCAGACQPHLIDVSDSVYSVVGKGEYILLLQLAFKALEPRPPPRAHRLSLRAMTVESYPR